MNTTGKPLVGILMGSDSDWPTMKAAADALAELGVVCEVNVMSAHRTPDDVAEYSRTAEKRGLKVIVAGAGGAAHLVDCFEVPLRRQRALAEAEVSYPDLRPLAPRPGDGFQRYPHHLAGVDRHLR